MFECVAKGFEIREEKASLYSQVSVLVERAVGTAFVGDSLAGVMMR